MSEIEITPEFLGRLANQLTLKKATLKSQKNKLNEALNKDEDYKKIKKTLEGAKIDLTAQQDRIVKRDATLQKLSEDIEDSKSDVKDSQNAFSDYLSKYFITTGKSQIEFNGKKITIIAKCSVKPEQMRLFN